MIQFKQSLVHGIQLAACAATMMFTGAFLAVTPASAQDTTAEKPVLTVYTYRSFAGKYGPGPVLKQHFEVTCGCTLEWVQTDDAAALLARLKLEGETSKADVVLGLDTNLSEEAAATGLIAPHETDLSGLTLPITWTDTRFIPVDWSWFAFIYDETKLKNPPTSLKELSRREDLKILIQDPRTSTPGLGLMLWVRALYGSETDEIWRDLGKRAITVTKGWSEAYGLFLKDEADMVLSYVTSPAYHVGAEQKTQYKAAIFSEGHYLQVEIAGRLLKSPQPELAKRFLAFLLSPEAQAAIPGTNWMYPAKLDPTKLPTSFLGLTKPEKSLLLPAEEINSKRREWTDAWLAAMRR